MNKKTKKLIAQIIEKELVVILAIVLLLGMLFGYSLAAGKNTESTTFDTTSIIEDSLMRANFGGEVD